MFHLELQKRAEFRTFIDCKPIAKQSVRTSKGHFYTSKKQADYVKKLKEIFKFRYKQVQLDGFVYIEIGYCFGPRTIFGSSFYLGRVDLDNLTKPVLDAMSGIVFKDDKQVVHATLWKYRGHNQGLDIEVGKILIKV